MVFFKDNNQNADTLWSHLVWDECFSEYLAVGMLGSP